MKTRRLPRTNLTASVLCLGTAAFGSAIDSSSSEKILETYVDAGGNVLDTAEIYAAWLPNGEHRSETFLGEWLRKRKNRDQLIVSTKGAHPRLDSMDKPRLSKPAVESDLNSSLQRLGIECIDVYWLHRDDPGTPVEEIILMLEDFRKATQANGYFRRLENGTLDLTAESVRALFHSPENQERYKRIKALQSATGLSVGAIVLGYLLSQPFPVFPNIGPKAVADLLESIEAAKATLSAENLAFLTG